MMIGSLATWATSLARCTTQNGTDKGLASSNEYDSVAEDFEKKEHELFGEDGFEKMVQRVAQLEQALGIRDLNRFTPRG